MSGRSLPLVLISGFLAIPSFAIRAETDLEELSVSAVNTSLDDRLGKTLNGVSCSCGADDDEWTTECVCEVNGDCLWDFARYSCPGAETGPEDELVPADATYESSGRGIVAVESAVKVVANFPIVSQNTLSGCDGGSHACWAVARASAAKFAGVLGTKGPKTEAQRLYKAAGCTTGWFAPKGSTGGTLKFPLGSKISRIYDGGNNGQTISGIAKKIRSVLSTGNAITVAMAKADCKSTFHYVSIVGIGTKPGSGLSVNRAAEWTDENVKEGVHLIVSDAWCPGYNGQAFFTSRDSKTLEKYDTGMSYSDTADYTLDNHPCIHKTPITQLTERSPSGQESDEGRTGKVQMLWIDDLEYASGARCMFKMWQVSRQ